ncbi:MAG TPA: metallophosphoesterase family protein [Blastocatellia bacterium]|jgi:serine/threonine protein phosphatase 1|nr:metallophosphoesterase family protein [Blastocatellia bacterium]
MATYVIGDIHGRPSLVEQLFKNVPWDLSSDKIVFLGDLIDRGNDAPTVVDMVMDLTRSNPNVIVLRGNHEQMMLDCLDYGDLQWLIPENGGLATLSAYGFELEQLKDVSDIKIPEDHVAFFRSLPFYHEDEQAIYVHAGLIPGEPASETDPDVLVWTRDLDFFKGYEGKLCFFGHTPTQYLPRDGRNRKFGIYIHGSCVGIDTSGENDSPLSCIQVETFTLYQAHPSGKTEVERLRERKPAAPALL